MHAFLETRRPRSRPAVSSPCPIVPASPDSSGGGPGGARAVSLQGALFYALLAGICGVFDPIPCTVSLHYHCKSRVRGSLRYISFLTLESVAMPPSSPRRVYTPQNLKDGIHLLRGYPVCLNWVSAGFSRFHPRVFFVRVPARVRTAGTTACFAQTELIVAANSWLLHVRTAVSHIRKSNCSTPYVI